ncbi:MAG TPA: hypothetical protein ENN81_12345, partial [Phycisphaerales bacterium]|nr:hypothetical protein [Phycisphaerales bacterium]
MPPQTHQTHGSQQDTGESQPCQPCQPSPPTLPIFTERPDSAKQTQFPLLKELNLEDNTLVIFTSDNGPTFAGDSDPTFFNSAGPFRGLKGSVYEGRIRVPFIARWPGRIKPGSTSDHVSAFWDFLPTCCELTGRQIPQDIDGVSMLPALLGRDNQKQHEYLYWELNGQQAIRVGDWKALRNKPWLDVELYNLAEDMGEKNNLAKASPDFARRLTEMIEKNRTDSDVFPL